MKESQEELQAMIGEDPSLDYFFLNQTKRYLAARGNNGKENGKNEQNPVEIKEFSNYFRVNSY